MASIAAEVRHAAARPLERALAVGAIAAYLSRGPSLVPRTREDQVLIAAGAGAMGVAAGLVLEGATALLGRGLPGGRTAAGFLLGGLGTAAWMWASEQEERTALANGVETAGGVAMVAGGAGELGRLALAAMPDALRAHVEERALALGAAGVSAFRALRRATAEPRDRVKASIRYDYLPSVSGGEGSLAPLDTLDREGRKFLGLAVPAEAIAEVMGAGARSPIRVYVGLGTAATPEERVRVALDELERLGAFRRRRILVACPSGAGFVTPVPVEAEEYMTRGDVASVAVQYNDQRSHRSLDKLPVGIATLRLLLQALRDRLQALPPDERPELIAYGESMGAWIAAEIVAEGGLRTLEEARVARAVLMGVPFDARRKLSRLREREGVLPESVGVFTTSEEVVSLPPERQARLAYVLLTHPEDPVANFSGRRLLVERPTWLSKGPRRHPRVPREMRWLPGITYLQVLFDIKNGTSFTADFEAYAHDYRLGVPAVVRIAFGHRDEVSPEQLARIEERTAASARAQAEREAAARERPPLPGRA